MALSNRDRVGRGFELLAAGLRPYVDRRMRAASRSGKDWLREYTTQVQVKGEVSIEDPSFLLRVMADSWERAFSSELRRSDRNLVFELRDVRNRWAHNASFTVGDAYRALDSMERLLASVDAAEVTAIGQAKDELARQLVPASVTPAAVQADAASRPVGGLRPWRDVVQPHDDVAQGGRFNLAEFAADLYQVSRGEGRDEYRDPVEFFRRTFITDGLRQLLTGALERLGGTGGSPVVDVQTAFGGGKTHSLIALYHLFSGTPLGQFPPEVQDLVRAAGLEKLPPVQRAVLACHRIPAGQAMLKPDGTEVRTLWGELAWQLGGANGYAEVAEADRTGTNPGDALRAVIQSAAPCLILVDEWVAYARTLYGNDDLVGGSFDTHFTFAQVLTEVVRQTDRALLVVSLPASTEDEHGSGSARSSSTIEVGGPGGREALRRLRSVIGRLESSWRPATAEESFEIVRRRLFQPIEEAALPDRDAVARAFGELYRRQASEFPSECREPAYGERIKRAYPFHPELFARLYEDWASLERFQRTRGVLRLLACVVYALWAGQDQSPMVMPGGIPMSDERVVTELTRNLEDNWKPIIDSEIDGPSSLARTVDDQYKNLGRMAAAHRVARTVFIGSAPKLGSPNQGLDPARVRLGCAMPGETVAIFGDALSRLAARSSHLYSSEDGRWWYGTQPGVMGRARDRAERLLAGDRHEVLAKLAERLRALKPGMDGPFAAVHGAPAGPADVRDEARARLVVLAPDTPHRPRSEESPAQQLSAQILDQRAGGPRDFRNMLVFLAVGEGQVEELMRAVAEQMAWESLQSDYDSGTLDLARSQYQQVIARAKEAKEAVEQRLLDAYQWILVPHQPEPGGPIAWSELKADGAGGLVARAGTKLDQAGALYTTYAPALLRLTLDGPLSSLWESGWVEVGRLWDAYSRYLYVHRLKDENVLLSCVQAGPASTTWESEGFAVAEAVDPRLPGRLVGLLASVGFATAARETTLVVRPDVALAQLEAEAAAPGKGVGSTSGGIGGAASGSSPEGGAPGAAGAQAGSPVKGRFYGSGHLDPARMSRDASRLAEDVVAHLYALDGTQVEVTIEVTATNPSGFPEAVQKLVDENAGALGMHDRGFEPE
jgi:predicted AAA+ superfamily ATPase